MYDNVFNRVEKKYLLTKEQRELLFDRINEYLNEDRYFKSTICNIYFDTVNNDLIINSIDKPVFKQKFRLRSYFVPGMEDDVFLENKTKYKGIVNKRRVKMKLRDYYKYEKNNYFSNDSQILKEFSYFFNYYDLKPYIYIAYDRLSYVGKNDSQLRITIDSNLRSRTEDLKLELGDAGKKFFKEDMYIMEIKTLGAMPFWLVNALSELKIYPRSFSKFGRIYLKERGR
ncbi:MAG: polyphosphate polymerase domain-containing protein [Bacilli bacterium]|nr:polyphosphate polymerase domain-containing protein [Bacilli bacterium]